MQTIQVKLQIKSLEVKSCRVSTSQIIFHVGVICYTIKKGWRSARVPSKSLAVLSVSELNKIGCVTRDGVGGIQETISHVQCNLFYYRKNDSKLISIY